MLFHFFTSLIDQYSFNVFKYLTFRTGLSVITFNCCFYHWCPLVKIFSENDNGPIRQDGPIDHIVKNRTPTMGGVIIIIGIILSTLLVRFN